MSIHTYIKPPSWMPNAKPSIQGWHHPVTNELLVSVPGGVPIVETMPEKNVISEVITDSKVIDENIIEEKKVIDETIFSESQVISEEKKKSTRKKSAK